ncbi:MULTISPECIES: alpha/beta hydrolase [Legionella]|uniref:alpha/beta hydrolase n=1 Tax=Legionella TaxID=445 RepID=UPI00095E4495|nr:MULTISPECIES: alpha/beta hydrolase-fold protein [Legionella]MBN9228015.1 alpha/beta hydrolase [Legionella steelei]OJW14366.1 MAG: esterase [Legionella sp. 39-23]
MKIMLTLFILISSLSLMAAASISTKIQSNPLEEKYTNTFSLHHTLTKEFPSKINGIKYNLYISLPKEYDSNKKDYPTIYLLDADYSFALAKQISEHLSDRNRINDSIIVGIAYANPNEYKKNRTRDYTPSYVGSGGYGAEYQKYSGGAESFYRFIHSELIPYLHQIYRVNKTATFVGHSYGGLFGVYLLVYHPGIFNRYIIVSPSLWYDNHLVLKAAQKKRNFNLEENTRVCFIIGDQENKGDYQMIDDLKLLNEIIMSKPHRNLSTAFNVLNNMDHDTVFPGALSLGLLESSSDFKKNRL